MTRQELADKVGVARQTINAIEAGKYSPSLEVAFESPPPSACRSAGLPVRRRAIQHRQVEEGVT